MANSILNRKLFELPHPSWWLWLIISIPLWAYFFFVPNDRVVSFTISDWNWILFYIHGVGFIRLFSSWTWWGFDGIGGALIDGLVIPIVIGYFAQYALLFVWRIFRRQPALKK